MRKWETEWGTVKEKERRHMACNVSLSISLLFSHSLFLSFSFSLCRKKRIVDSFPEMSTLQWLQHKSLSREISRLELTRSREMDRHVSRLISSREISFDSTQPDSRSGRERCVSRKKGGWGCDTNSTDINQRSCYICEILNELCHMQSCSYVTNSMSHVTYAHVHMWQTQWVMSHMLMLICDKLNESCHICDMTHWVLDSRPGSGQRKIVRPYCNILQHTATHCNTLQHTVTHTTTHTTLQHRKIVRPYCKRDGVGKKRHNRACEHTWFEGGRKRKLSRLEENESRTHMCRHYGACERM